MLEKYKEFMQKFISYKSISTDSEYKNACKDTTLFLKSEFEQKGFKVEVIEGFGNPIFTSEYIYNAELKTVLIYGHYDVQPADISEGWAKDPFSIFEKDGRLIARGIVDNKGQIGVHIVTVFNLIEEGKLKYNVKFIIEGDEETGSEHLPEFFNQHAHKLKADFVLISDGELMAGHPLIDIGYRGIFNSTLKIKTSEKDNHSGLYGGSIPNAVNELTQLLSKMHNANGRLEIPGINNNYLIDPTILANNKQIPFDAKNTQENTGAKKILGDDVDFYTLTGYLTSAEVTGIQGGYIAEGYKNAIPGSAFAKINFRLAGNMSVDSASKAFIKFIEDNKPEYIDYEFIIDQANEPIVLDYKNEYIQNTTIIQKEVYGVDTLLLYCGAIIPIAGYFQAYLKVPVISAGMGNEDCNMHGVNENFKIEDLNKGLEFSKKLLSN